MDTGTQDGAAPSPRRKRQARSDAGNGKRGRQRPAAADGGIGGNLQPAAAGPMTLHDFLGTAGTLTDDERKLIVRQALILMEQNYAHLPLKRAMHSVEPVQRLKLLLQTLESAAPEDRPDEAAFHRELTSIFTSVRDLHTNYLLPEPFNAMAAVLPFAVEDYFEGKVRKYMVAHVAQGFSHASFVPGVELTHWNGVPIERAVWNVADRYAGSNREARHARGVQNLTVRALRIAPAPDEDWVIIGYRTLQGAPAELRFDWKVIPPLANGGAEDAVDVSAQAAMGLDLEQDIVRRVRMEQFAPQVAAQADAAQAKAASGQALDPLESLFPGTFSARPVQTPSGTFGYLRIRTFGSPGPADFVKEFLRLVAALPQNGLVIDVRANGGGIIHNGELLLQTLTPHRIEPEPVQFLNTPLNLKICARHKDDKKWTNLSAWEESMLQALRTGSVYSAGFPITDPVRCNDIGQKYFSPVVLVTDALCYSTTDIFAAGFQDHDIGPILGVDGNTGAGGANVWEHQYFVSHIYPGGDYQPLPKGAGMRVAMRRSLRVARRAGAPLEDLGVVPTKRHYMTRDDVLKENVDLIAAAGALLAQQGPARSLKVSTQRKPEGVVVAALADNISDLDAYIDDRPVHTMKVAGAGARFTLPADVHGTLELRGYDDGKLVARYRERLQ